MSVRPGRRREELAAIPALLRGAPVAEIAKTRIKETFNHPFRIPTHVEVAGIRFARNIASVHIEAFASCGPEVTSPLNQSGEQRPPPCIEGKDLPDGLQVRGMDSGRQNPPRRTAHLHQGQHWYNNKVVIGECQHWCSTDTGASVEPLPWTPPAGFAKPRPAGWQTAGVADHPVPRFVEIKSALPYDSTVGGAANTPPHALPPFHRFSVQHYHSAANGRIVRAFSNPAQGDFPCTSPTKTRRATCRMGQPRKLEARLGAFMESP